MLIAPEFEAEIVDCLRRSGYLMESRLVRTLVEARFFVEPNVALVDARTGKSREIDILAEYFDYDPNIAKAQVTARTTFVIEAINNRLPLVLLTEHPESPISDFENYVRYSTTPSAAPFEEQLDIAGFRGLFNTVRYSQYCALSRKKAGDELMASHPDDLYASFLKLAEFIEHEVQQFNTREWQSGDQYWRVWFWQGILVVGGDLLIAKDDGQGHVTLAEVDSAPLVFNFHLADERRTAVIQVVRERELLSYLTSLLSVDSQLTQQLYNIRTSKLADGA
jgi:hypothetical protein